jgi:hypothetical protein
METASLLELARSMTRERFIGSFSSRFLVVEACGRRDEFDFDTAIASEPFRAGSKEREILELVKARGNPYPDRISVGRARNCDVVVRDPSVSKLHAHIREHAGAVQVVDLGSQNGTRVNGSALAAHVPGPAAVGDRIEFGNVATRLFDAGALFDYLRAGG